MRSKLVALAALLFFFALLEYRLAPRPSTASPSRAKDMVRRLLPTAICNFELTGRWQSNLDQHTVEAITSYPDASGTVVDVDMRLGASAPHNALACWYVRGEPMLWQVCI